MFGYFLNPAFETRELANLFLIHFWKIYYFSKLIFATPGFATIMF